MQEEKAMFESVMWTYIREEELLLNQLLNSNNVPFEIHKLSGIKALYVTAHGSSYNAACAAAPIISRLAGIRTYCYTPAAFRFNAPSIDHESAKDTWVLGISQTGTSRGVLEAVKLAKDKGFHAVGITAVPDSPISRLCDVTFDLACGEEDSNAKTKGYSSTLTVLMILGAELGRLNKTLSDTEYQEFYDELRAQVNDINAVTERTLRWCEANRYGIGMDNLYVVGTGINAATAMEGQLKLMETQCVPTMFNDIGEFSHGMHRSLTKHSNVILLNSREDRELTETTMKYLREKQIPALMINAQEESSYPDVINVGCYPKTSSVLLITTAIQVISVFVPEINGLDPNRNANNDYTEVTETRV